MEERMTQEQSLDLKLLDIDPTGRLVEASSNRPVKPLKLSKPFVIRINPDDTAENLRATLESQKPSWANAYLLPLSRDGLTDKKTQVLADHILNLEIKIRELGGTPEPIDRESTRPDTYVAVQYFKISE